MSRSKRTSITSAYHRESNTSASRSLTLAYGGYTQDVTLNPRASMQQLQDTIVKRIATLDYLRRTHEGTVYWLNTLALPKHHLLSLPYFDTRKLARRAHTHLVLGISLPAILDPHAANAVDYLRALNDLMAEYEAYCGLHGPDGHGSGSLGRRNLGLQGMFKRAGGGGTGGGKGRRTASGPGMGMGEAMALSPTGSLEHAGTGEGHGGARSFSTNSTGSSFPSLSFSGSFTSSFSSSDVDANEEYAYLLTPALPFEPDYFETFATLAEVLIDVYLCIKGFTATSESCTPTVVNLFAGADKRIRRVIVEGMVREVGESTRGEVRGEVAGLGRLVLGGLA